MAMRLFLLYAVVELAVLIALVSTIGFGWTVLAVLATFVLGLALAGSQVKRHFQRLRAGLSGRQEPLEAATDSLLMALGTVLVVVPGLASSVLGALLLLPPTRAVLRPVATALAARGIARHVPLITVADYRTGRGDYTDGEVVDGEVIDQADVDRVDMDQPRLPHRND